MIKTPTKTWIILASDGRHVSCSRVAEPDDATLDQAAEGLRNLGLGGWLCLMEGDYWAKKSVTLYPLRDLAEPKCAFYEAARKFYDIREGKF